MKEDNKNSNIVRFYIAIGILLLSIIGNGIFLTMQSGYKSEKDKALLSKDSLLSVKLLVDKELNKAKNDLKECEGKNDQLDASRIILNNQIQEKTLQVEKLVKDNASVNTLRKKLKEVQKLRDECENLVNNYIAETNKLEADNKTLKQSFNKLVQENEDIKNKLEWAKTLKAYEIEVQGYKVTKSKQQPAIRARATIRARKTNRIAVSFTLAENRVVESGSKNFNLVVYYGQKKVLGKGNEKFTNKKTNAQQVYSAIMPIEFKNDEQKITLNFDTQDKLIKGKYSVEIYSDGNLSGTKEFELR
jgi:hypothetical protein